MTKTEAVPALPVASRATVRLRSAWACFGDRADGDMARDDNEGRDARLASLASFDGLSCTWLRQVHGARVVRVSYPGQGAGEEGDALVTAEDGCALAVLSADCAPVALASSEGVLGVAHAGWAGMLAGVIENAVAAMRELGATHVAALVGPCIGPECYEFGDDLLDQLAAQLGNGVRARTTSGRPALDLPAAAAAALTRAGVDDVRSTGPCTACSPDHFSWRAGGEHQRQATVVWR
ncbi:MAG: polyphenol oxidase family protein [Acidimicrobiales bacterium]